MARWTQQADGSYLFTPVTAVGENIHKKIAIVADPVDRPGKVHLVLIGQHGDTDARVLRPADARRIGTALIEAALIADQDAGR